MDENKMSQVLELQELSKTDGKELQRESDYFEQEGFKFKRSLIEPEADHVPQNIKDKSWVFTANQDLILSNLDKEDIKRILLWKDIEKIDWMMSQPDYKISFADMRDIDQARVLTLIRAKRSFGGPDRERALIATEFKEIRTPERRTEGILSKIFGGVKG